MPYFRTVNTLIHVKTTLVLSDTLVKVLKREAARRGCSMSSLVESALRRLLEEPVKPPSLPPIPTFRAGRAAVDVTNRDALHDFMEKE